MKLAIALTAALAFSPMTVALAQADKVDLYSAEQLTHSTSANSAAPATGALVQGILKGYPQHYTMLIVRHEDGQSELHEHTADVFFVVEGKAQLWTGGSMTAAKETEPGEKRGSGLSGASLISIKKGDIVHIPANLPHQLRLPTHGSFTYFVVKVEEPSGASVEGH